MSLTKIQFEIVVTKVIEKIISTEGAIGYVYETPGCFDNTRGKGHLYYQATTSMLIDLNALSKDGAMIPSNDYSTFINQLLVDAEELIKSVKLQRQPFIDYLEKIKFL